MKPADNDIKKAFRQLEIPEPSETAKNKAVRKATDEFVKINITGAKKTKGFQEFLRRMGKIFQTLITMKGEPIMTQRQFATLGIMVIAFGLILSIGPQVFYSSKTVVDKAGPQSHQTAEIDRELPDGRQPGNAKNDKPETTVLPSKEQTAAQKTKDFLADTKTEMHKNVPGEMRQEEPLAVMQAPAPSSEKAAGKGYTAMLSEMASGSVRGRRALESDDGYGYPSLEYYQDAGRDKFAVITLNPVRLAGEEPVSTFSIDVDTASYAFVRRQLNSGLLPQKDAVRVEELINYFDYDYPVPQDRVQPFQPTVALYPTPWNSNTKLLHIGIKGYDIVPTGKPRSNLVFLLDISGSMNSPDKLPLLKNSFAMLVDSLSPDDTVAIVVYAGASGTVLEPTKVKEKGKILASLDKLSAGGSTAGGEGIRLAYTLAEMNFDEEAVNRVILATDGDFNVGITNQNELKSFIERKRATGIFLSVLGFGQGNYNDALMQALAQNGNGNAAYIDNLNEARKVLVDEACSTLFTIAKDVKIQIEFNPARVHDYRLIGYETRLLKREDFNNDKVDAGDVGSGHTVTAIYEITPVESGKKLIDDLRYRKTPQKPKVDAGDEYAFLKIRYKLPGEDASKLIAIPVTTEQEFDTIAKTPEDMRFAAAVAAFGQVLRNAQYTGDFSYDDILQLAEPARGRDQFGYRTEFLNLVRLAKTAKAM
ncbi:MAG: VWA domain-containing protein [Desulfobulbaceae bacterium]|nr:VWA domain-containing protein [Desulfobulbaceae bacterium]